MQNVNLTINGKKVTAQKGKTVLETALGAGIYIPNLCHDSRLKPYAACRLCLVEIEGMKDLQTACTTATAEGMVVKTNSEEINNLRKMSIELLITEHPQDCLTCSSNQRCELQRLAAEFGITTRRLKKFSREILQDTSNPFYTRDMSKCILCGKCVRACDEIRNVNAIDIGYRGFNSRIVAFNDIPIVDSNCETCGECIDICPVGALSANQEIFKPEKEVRTTCPYCGCGCGFHLGIKENKIVSIRGDLDNPVNKGSLCVKGRFEMDFVGSKERLTSPLIKKDGKFQKATWDEALKFVSEKFKDIKSRYGPDSLAGLSSAKCTNEENYLFQKFVRVVFGTNNVDHCARLCHASTVAGLARSFGSGAMTNSIEEIENAGCIFVIGSNTTEAHPIIALRIKNAVRKNNARLIVADPRQIELVKFSEIHLKQKPGTDVALINSMLNVIITEKLCNEKFISERTEGFDELKEMIKEYTPEYAQKITNVPAEDIRKAVRLYAQSQTGSIIYSMGITQHTTGTDNVLALANLAMVTGNLGRENTGVNPLRGQNNVQGACDMGALPNLYPGYLQANDEKIREKFRNAWNCDLLPLEPGLTVVEIMHNIESGKIKGLYLMGENPALSDPNINRTRKALSEAEFLVVQDIFLTETAEFADVVLPGTSFAEKDGTFTNTERRIQRIRKAIEPAGESKPDWQIICELSDSCGYPMNYGSPSDIMDEIALVTPIYGGVSYERLEGSGIQWPCPDRNHPGTAYLHKEKFSRGLGKFHPIPYRDPAELTDDEYPLILTTGRLLHYYHTGTMSRKTQGLEKLSPAGIMEINPEDAQNNKIKNNDLVEVSSRRGKITVKAKITSKMTKGTVFIAFHFKEAAANLLTNDALDPVAKIPEFKVCAVRIKKL